MIMKYYKLTKQDKDLIEIAREVIKDNCKRKGSIIFSVACALLSSSGKIYKGVNIKNLISSPVSIDAEMGTIDQMVTAGDRKIKTIVSVHKIGKKYKIFQPCGHCRQIIIQFGNPFVIISKNKKVKIKDLYPLPLK